MDQDVCLMKELLWAFEDSPTEWFVMTKEEIIQEIIQLILGEYLEIRQVQVKFMCYLLLFCIV